MNDKERNDIVKFDLQFRSFRRLDSEYEIESNEPEFKELMMILKETDKNCDKYFIEVCPLQMKLELFFLINESISQLLEQTNVRAERNEVSDRRFQHFNENIKMCDELLEGLNSAKQYLETHLVKIVDLFDKMVEKGGDEKASLEFITFSSYYSETKVKLEYMLEGTIKNILRAEEIQRSFKSKLKIYRHLKVI